MPVAEQHPRTRREPQVRAKQCEKCKSWDTHVYSTLRIVRYCRCRFCGHTWQQTPDTTHGNQNAQN